MIVRIFTILSVTTVAASCDIGQEAQGNEKAGIVEVSCDVAKISTPALALAQVLASIYGKTVPPAAIAFDAASKEVCNVLNAEADASDVEVGAELVLVVRKIEVPMRITD